MRLLIRQPLVLSVALLIGTTPLTQAFAFESSQEKPRSQSNEAANSKKPKKPRSNPAMAKIEDVQGLPRILLIGDSISIGYTVPVRELLKGKANVHRPLTNCGPTTKGVAELDKWLGDGNWDVIHFNFGLHDLKYMGPNGQNLANPEEETSHQQVPPEEYRRNLETIVKRLKKTGAKLIWRNTTPVPDGAKGRVVGDSKNYNAIAAEIMERYSIPTDDHYSFATERMKKIQQPANVHFTQDGSKQLAARVVDSLRQAIPALNE